MSEETPEIPKFNFVMPEAEEEVLRINDEMAINVEPGEITLYWACLVTFSSYMHGWIEQIPELVMNGKLNVTQEDGGNVQYHARYTLDDMKREHTVALFQDMPEEILDTPKVRERLKTESQVPQNWHTSTTTGLAILNAVGYFVEECNLQGKSLNERASSIQARTITEMGIQLGSAATTFTILENQLEMLRRIGKLFDEVHRDNPELVSLWFGPPPGNLQFFCEKFFSVNRAFERNLKHPEETERAALFSLAEDARKRMESEKGRGGAKGKGQKQEA